MLDSGPNSRLNRGLQQRLPGYKNFQRPASGLQAVTEQASCYSEKFEPQHAELGWSEGGSSVETREMDSCTAEPSCMQKLQHSHSRLKTAEQLHPAHKQSKTPPSRDEHDPSQVPKPAWGDNPAVSCQVSSVQNRQSAAFQGPEVAADNSKADKQKKPEIASCEGGAPSPKSYNSDSHRAWAMEPLARTKQRRIHAWLDSSPDPSTFGIPSDVPTHAGQQADSESGSWAPTLPKLMSRAEASQHLCWGSSSSTTIPEQGKKPFRFRNERGAYHASSPSSSRSTAGDNDIWCERAANAPEVTSFALCCLCLAVQEKRWC